MRRHKKVLSLIKSIRDSFVGAEQVYTSGSCFKLYKILKTQFSSALPYCDGSHIITEIDYKFYDINGVVDKEKVSDFTLLDPGAINWDYSIKFDDDQDVENWIFNIFDIHVECPNCEELFLKAELEPKEIEKTKARYD